jgi:hypothetical protein
MGFQMHQLLKGLIVTLIASVYFLYTAANAAVFRNEFPGCQDKDLLKQSLQIPKGFSENRSFAFLKSKVESGACVNFSKGQQVSIDQREGALWCVRRTGDLECYWTLDKAVDENPPITSGGGGQGGGAGRGEGHRGRD